MVRATPEPGGVYLEVNRAMEIITGYSREELLAMKVTDLNLNPSDRQPVLGKVLNSLATVAVETTLKKKDGTTRTVAIKVTPVRNDSGEIVFFDGIIEDVTDRKNMEEQLLIADRLASLGELASGVAHEVNNPLTGIIGLSQLLLGRDLPGDVKEDLEMVHGEAQRAARVVKNLLTFSRKHAVERQPTNLNEVISKVLELRAYEQKVNNILVVSNFAPDLPRVLADPFQLQQVFFNLVINAEYFMLEAHKKGTLVVTTQRAGDRVIISFSDDGPGISRENLNRLFTPFFTSKPVGKGTGLGLSICHGVVTAHGGRIRAESEPGKGATFIVDLPLAVARRKAVKNESG